MRMRGFMGLGVGLALGAALLTAAPAFAANTVAYVGTYTDTAAKGIYALKWDSAAKKFVSLGLQAEVARHDVRLACILHCHDPARARDGEGFCLRPH